MSVKPTLRHTLEPYLFLAPASLLLVGLLGFPLLFTFGISAFQWRMELPTLNFTGFDNYAAFLADPDLARLVFNSVVWTALGVATQFLVGLSLALATDSLRRSVADAFQILFIIPWVIPGVITSVIWQCMLQSDLGVVNYLLHAARLVDQDILWFSDANSALIVLVAINTWKAAPFWYLMLAAGLLDVPRDLTEAAKLDGAGTLRTFYHVTWQHLKPVVTSTLVLTTIWTFNSFDIIWTITKGGPLNTTATLPIYTYLEAFTYGDYGRAAAVAVVSLLVVVVVGSPYLAGVLRRLKVGTP